MNLIENLWAVLKAAVDKLVPKTVEDLKRGLLQAWDQIGIQKVNNLVNSFYQKIQLVINNNGESIQHDLKNDISK